MSKYHSLTRFFGASKYLANHAVAAARSGQKSDSCHIKANQTWTKLPSSQPDGCVQSGQNTVKTGRHSRKLWNSSEYVSDSHDPDCGSSGLNKHWRSTTSQTESPISEQVGGTGNPGIQNGVIRSKPYKSRVLRHTQRRLQWAGKGSDALKIGKPPEDGQASSARTQVCIFGCFCTFYSLC